ncbi:TPA: tail fiber assembly protein [Escherichia albertii]
MDFCGFVLFLTWKTYRVLLSRVYTSVSPDVEWLVIPEL